MVMTSSPEDETERYIHHCLDAYFDDAPMCDLHWITGMIGDARQMARVILVTHFGDRVFTDKYRELIDQL